VTSPRIIVAMGCYNEAPYLRETIPAVLAQTMPDFRLFILDNGSTDESWNILKGFDDPRITLVRSPFNLTCPAAANFGFGFCMDVWRDCRWFLGAGADDLMDPDYLEAILDAAAERPNVNLIFGPVRFIDHPEKGVWRYPPFDPKRVHQQLMVPGWRAFTRELWEAVGPEYTGMNQGSDWEWVCRATVKGVLRPYQLPRPHLALRVREGRTSQSELGDWSTLHARMCEMMYQPIPRWAHNERKDRPVAGRR
jgi:glycosyltransferase involved in cell wall biosynthesis